MVITACCTSFLHGSGWELCIARAAVGALLDLSAASGARPYLPQFLLLNAEVIIRLSMCNFLKCICTYVWTALSAETIYGAKDW